MKPALLGRPSPVIGAYAALLWERAARVWWPAVAFPAAFAVLAAFGLWDRVGDPWRALAAGATLLGVAMSLRGGLFRGGPWPSLAAARRRVEEDSELAERPYEALEDAPAQGDAWGGALWRAHQARMRARLAAAKARRPKAALAALDPMALRGVLLIAGIAGVLVAGDRLGQRLGDAFSPAFLMAGVSGLDAEAWIEPPSYTGRAPVFLTAATQARPAPAGSTAVLRVTGARRAPRAQFVDEQGRTTIPLEAMGAGVFSGKTALSRSGTLRVGGRSWRIAIVDDLPPRVAFVDEPKSGPRQELAFSYLAEDDYGVTELALRVTLAETGEAFDSALAVPARAAAEGKDSVDLTQHPWAGRKVAVALVARDALGQMGVGAPVEMILPERVLVDPLARAVAEQRKQFFLAAGEAYAPPPEGAAPLTAPDIAARPPFRMGGDGERIARAPAALQRMKEAVALVSKAPELFADDPVVQLGLAYVEGRLRDAKAMADLGGMPDVLWDLALRAEGGDLADAERAMRAAEKALADALARGAEQAEIDKLMEAYQNSVQRYLEALRREALENGLAEMPGGAGGGMMSKDELAEMLKALEELAATGSRDDARRLLSMLAELLANLEMKLVAGEGGEGSESNSALREELEKLGDLIGRQRELMDQTFAKREGREEEEEKPQAKDEPSGERAAGEKAEGEGERQAAQQGQKGEEGQAGEKGENREKGEKGFGAGGEPREEGEGGQGRGSLAQRQGGLGDEVGELREGLGPREGGDARSGLAEAEEAMRAAEGALGAEALDRALDAQGRALEGLRAGAEELAKRAAEAEQARRGERGGGEQAGQAGQTGRDPFGRRSGFGGFGEGGVKVPDEMERRRAREILDELRKRAGETERPEPERNYIRRLIDRF